MLIQATCIYRRMKTMPGRNFRLTERDYAILEIIGMCRALTSEQIGLYIWETVGVFTPTDKENPENCCPPEITVHSNCQKRLLALRTLGLIGRVERYSLPSMGKQSYFYMLTPKGAACLAAHREIPIEDLQWRRTDSRLRPNYVEHLIMTNDVRLALMRLTKKGSPLQLVQWDDEMALAQRHKDLRIPLLQSDKSVKYVSLIPDAYFVLRTSDGHEHRFFLEADRGTETTISSSDGYRSWYSKIETYIHFLYSERDTDSLYKQRYGTAAGRVLTVTTSNERLVGLVRASEKAHARTRFWFTTREEITRVSLTEIIGKKTRKGNPRYRIQLPVIWTDLIWRVATDGERRHALAERSEEIRRQD
jgi:hypothetical protein